MPAIVIMGPSGCGKSTLGKALAAHLDWTFVEGDEFHPQTNIEKMSAGIPLTDEDRTPFLKNVGKTIRENETHGVVVACSALKQAYRSLIRTYAPGVLFVLPPSEKEQLLENMKIRGDHFMPVSLVDSQLADLELPGADENALCLKGLNSIHKAIQEIEEFLKSEEEG